MGETIILDEITITRTIEDGEVLVGFEISDDCAFYDAHAMLSIALNSLDSYFGASGEDD